MSPISRAFDGFLAVESEREVSFGSCQIAISGPFGTRPKLQRDVPSGLIESAHGSALADCSTTTTRVVHSKMRNIRELPKMTFEFIACLSKTNPVGRLLSVAFGIDLSRDSSCVCRVRIS